MQEKIFIDVHDEETAKEIQRLLKSSGIESNILQSKPSFESFGPAFKGSFTGTLEKVKFTLDVLGSINDLINIFNNIPDETKEKFKEKISSIKDIFGKIFQL